MGKHRLIASSLAGIVLVPLITYLVIWPAPIDPVYWDEPEPPAATGPLAPNNDLDRAALIGRDLIEANEDLVLAPGGALYLSTFRGYLQRLDHDDDGNWRIQGLEQVSERALLGLQWIDDDRIAIAAIDGLYAFSLSTGEREILSTGTPQRPFGFVNDVDVGPDGTIYFSDSTTHWDVTEEPRFQRYELLENRPHGFVYAYDPVTRATRVVMDRLYYPNGVTVTSDGAALLVAETTRYRIRRLWLSGPLRGQVDTLAANLPGTPDGIMSDGHGRVFIGMRGPRREMIAFLHRNPFITRILSKFGFAPGVSAGQGGAFVLVLDENSGETLNSFHDGANRLISIANVVPDGQGTLWITGNIENVVARFELPDGYDQPGLPNGEEELVGVD